MIVVDISGKTLEVVLGGAVAATQLPFVVNYTNTSREGRKSIGSQHGTTNNTTAVAILGAPASGGRREAESISVYNVDTASATVTIRINDNSTTRIIAKVTLTTLDHLMYTAAAGWFVITSQGFIKSTSTAVNLDDLGDVAITSPATNSVLLYNGSTWLDSSVTYLNALTANRILYGSATDTVGTSANLTFDGTTLTAHTLTVSTGTLTTYEAFTMGSGGIGGIFTMGIAVPTSNNAARFNLYISNTVRNWRFGTNDLTADAFTITPSTANGGTTFTTAAISIAGATGAVTLTTTAGNPQLNLVYSGFDTYAFRRQAGTGLEIYNITDTRQEMFFDGAGGVTIPGTLGVTGLTTVTTAGIAVPVSALGTCYSATYTPTLTDTANISSSTTSLLHYSRVGNVVTVSGEVNITITTTLTDTQLTMTIPVASNFTLTTDCGGTAAAYGTNEYAFGFYADAANDKVIMRGKPVFTGALTFAFIFSYLVK